MDNTQKYFYLSGFISLSIFTLFLTLFFYMIFHSSKIDTFAFNKDTFISISLDTVKVKAQKSKKSAKSITPIVEKSVIPQNLDVNDLFSDVWTKKIVKSKPKNKRRIAEIEKKLQTTTENRVEKFDKLIIDRESTESDEVVSSSTANEVNEYLAKIQAIVYKNFHVPPNSQGHSVKAHIMLNTLGRLIDFRILTYSENQELNNEADKIKQRLQNVIFPINPQNKSSDTIVILTSKE